jgi:ectoine hydroxylase-related dioxygenase (phytanoyl-CoA dioxygenase family)
MTAAEPRQQLDDLGYVLMRQVMDSALLCRLRDEVERLFAAEGEAAGAEFKIEQGARRLANLAKKAAVFREIILHPAVMPLVGHVLQQSVKLSSVNARSVNPYGGQPQPLHCDMSALPDERGPWVCNTVWMLDDFTEQNGALRVIPGSHRWNRLPQQALEDPRADHAQQQVITGPAGSVIVMNAHLWHGGMANRSDRPRTAVHAFYCRRDNPQQQYQKQLLDAELQAALSPSLRELLALDDPLNDELSSQNVVRSGFLADSKPA